MVGVLPSGGKLCEETRRNRSTLNQTELGRVLQSGISEGVLDTISVEEETLGKGLVVLEPVQGRKPRVPGNRGHWDS